MLGSTLFYAGLEFDNMNNVVMKNLLRSKDVFVDMKEGYYIQIYSSNLEMISFHKISFDDNVTFDVTYDVIPDLDVILPVISPILEL